MDSVNKVCGVYIYVAYITEEDAPGAAMWFGDAWASCVTIRYQ